MCRMVGYLGGPEVTLSSLVIEPDHSLLVQSYAPREMLSGVVNADGFGVGWYAPWSGEEPAVYRSNQALWADRTFAGIAPRIRARSIFAAVRSATPGLPAEESGVPPFASGPFTFMHNGAIKDFRRTAMRPLRDGLSDEVYAGLLGTTDSETIFAVLLDYSKEGRDLAGTTAATVRRVSEVCRGLGVYASLNLAVTDGEEMVFTRYSTDGVGNSLYFIEDGRAFPGATVVASERLDSDRLWRPVPEQHLLSVKEDSGAKLLPLWGGDGPDRT
ncbi:MAG: ergothioneine biosynthesis protein EgtC [Actinomycetota bacterium]|nr:ergothioneine biosynthesis protein EgtC [Actinomycetota bacterium]